MLKITFLGTGGTMPTTSRSSSAIMIDRKGELLLFDCGEGAQRQMMKAKTGMINLTSIFITHYHGDHFLGIPGLIQTMSFQGRTEPLHIYGPAWTHQFVKMLTSLGYYKLSFSVEDHEIKPGDKIERPEYTIHAVKTEHGIPSIGYVLEENPLLGRFNREKAIELGVPPGPLFSKLHSGQSVFVAGNEIKPEQVVGKQRPGRKIVYTGDTRPCDAIIKMAKNADLLIHDGTLADDLQDWAIESKHSTAKEAATVANAAQCKELVLTHISSRYSDDPSSLLNGAKSIFKNVSIAQDFMEVVVPYPD
ncbi:MAG: ribonuclease Z [Methanosarcinales archaeon Met12]|nr:MAG: ribonuclease Z [Methanosarcinales archaeon Met12]